MNIRQHLKLAVISGLCIVTLAGCDSFKKSGVSGSEGKIVNLADGRQVVVSDQSDNNKASKDSKEKKEKPSKKPEKEKVTGLNTTEKVKSKKPSTDRSSVDANTSSTENKKGETTPTATVTGETANNNCNLNGEWTIYSVRGNIVTGEERPYITFDIPVNRFYGNNGCNYINGDLSIESNSGVKFTNMISTMKMCQDDQYQYLINLALNDVVTYSTNMENHETMLNLKDESGRTILVLRRHNMEFLNGGWKVSELNGTPLTQTEEASITFNTTDLKIHGTTGCNIFNGELFIDPDKTTSLQILQLITTRMACPNDSIETEFLLALESVETAKSTGDDEVTLYNTEGKPLFKLTKLNLLQQNSAE